MNPSPKRSSVRVRQACVAISVELRDLRPCVGESGRCATVDDGFAANLAAPVTVSRTAGIGAT